MKLHYLGKQFFSIAYQENIYEVGQRLRVKGAGTSGSYYRKAVVSLIRVQRYFGLFKHIEISGIGHLILEGDPYHFHVL